MKKSIIGLLSLCMLAFLPGTQAQAQSNSNENHTNENSGLGLNLTGLAYWSSQWMLLDVMKQASNGSGELWATSNGRTWDFNTGHQSRLDLDEAGWPRSLPASDDPDFHYVTTIIYHDNEHNPEGRFVVLYDGEGTLEYSGPTLLESSPGRDIVQLNAGQFFHLRILATDPQQNGNYLRNIRIIVPGGSCSSAADDYAVSAQSCANPENYQAFEQSYSERIFHPLFIQDVKHFRTLRFMQFLSTINNPVQNWQERAPYHYASWALGKGSPYELAIELANKTNAEPWFNLPVRINNNYIEEFARLVRNRLKPDLNFYVEFGNELWNNAWPYNMDAEYLANRGRELWPETNGEELHYRLNYYGMRSHQMCDITKTVFDENSERVLCVMGGQTGVPWVAEQSLACPYYAPQNGNTDCGSNMDVLAVGNYFAGYFADERYLNTLNQWAGIGAQGIDNLFAEFYHGVLRELTYHPDEPEWWQAPEHGALAQAREQIASSLALAQQYQLMLASYESGQHLTYAGAFQNGRDTITEQLFLPANRDPRMAAAYQRYLSDWIDAGGGLNILFESTGVWDRWGAFPLKESQLQTDSVKFNAVQGFMQERACWWSNCERQLSPVDQPNSPGNDDAPPSDEPLDYHINLAAEPIVESRGISLSWHSNLPEGAEFQLYRDETLIWQGTATSYEQHWLTTQQDYHYRIEFHGEDVVSSETLTVQAGDSQPPGQVTNLNATVIAGQVQINWQSAEDNHGIKGYMVFRNDQPYGWLSDQAVQFVDPWPPAEENRYDIIAVDNSDNRGEAASITINIP